MTTQWSWGDRGRVTIEFTVRDTDPMGNDDGMIVTADGCSHNLHLEGVTVDTAEKIDERLQFGDIVVEKKNPTGFIYRVVGFDGNALVLQGKSFTTLPSEHWMLLPGWTRPEVAS